MQRNQTWVTIAVIVFAFACLAVAIGFEMRKRNPAPPTAPSVMIAPTIPEPTPGKSDVYDDIDDEWVHYESRDGGYSFDFPKAWHIQKSPEDTYDRTQLRGVSSFENEPVGEEGTRLTTRIYGSVDLVHATVSEQNFYDTNSSFWPTRLYNLQSDCGPVNTVVPPVEQEVNGRKVFRMQSHPICNYDSATPDLITEEYQIFVPGDTNDLFLFTIHYDKKNPNIDLEMKRLDRVVKSIVVL